LVFLAFDVPFLLANCLKFFDGGYLPFAVGVAFVLVMVSWRIGRSYLAEEISAQSPPVETFLTDLKEKVLARIPGTAIVLASQTAGVPPVLSRLFQRFRVVHENVVLVTVVTEHVPFVPDKDRSCIEQLGEGLSRVVLRYGFMEEPHIPSAVERAL